MKLAAAGDMNARVGNQEAGLVEKPLLLQGIRIHSLIRTEIFVCIPSLDSRITFQGKQKAIGLGIALQSLNVVAATERRSVNVGNARSGGTKQPVRAS